METTQSKRRRLPMILCGLLLSTGAFLFGTFMALPALVVLVPRMRRFWLFGLALFLGVLCVRGLSLLGLNPLVYLACNRAAAELSEALGGEVSYAKCSGDVPSGQLSFSRLHVKLPDVGGELTLDEVNVDAGMFLLIRPDGYKVEARGMDLRLDASGGKVEQFLKTRKHAGRQASLRVDGGNVTVYGSPTTAGLELTGINATSGETGWTLNVGLSKARLTVAGQPHELEVYGGFSVGDEGQGLWMQADMRVAEAELGSGIVRGGIGPGGGALVCTLDMLNVKPLWARYRKVDTYDGTVQGTARVTGNLARLQLDFEAEVSDFSYYHFTAMGLNPEDAFKVPQAWISGRVLLIDGATCDLESVKVEAASATLATGPRMNATGGGTLVLKGRLPNVTGELDVVVASASMSQEISWNPLSMRSLSDVQPNIVVVAEQFASLDLAWRVDVKALNVDCEPLKGTLAGKLQGTFRIQGGRNGTLLAGGELVMADGRVKCLGIDGDLQGRVIFNPNAPTRHASLRGTLTASLGDTPIDCELTGELSRPGFTFKGANMAPEALGKKIFSYSPEPLTRAQLLERREQLNRIFGPSAAATENPFVAKNSGKVFFNVK